MIARCRDHLFSRSLGSSFPRLALRCFLYSALGCRPVCIGGHYIRICARSWKDRTTVCSVSLFIYVTFMQLCTILLHIPTKPTRLIKGTYLVPHALGEKRGEALSTGPTSPARAGSAGAGLGIAGAHGDGSLEIPWGSVN